MMQTLLKSRPLHACFIVLALVVAVPVSGMVEKHVCQIHREPPAQGIQTSTILETSDPQVSLSQIENLVQPSTQVPEYFTEEIGFIPEARDVHVSDDGSVVGYLSDKLPKETFEDVCALMHAAGWDEVPLGQDYGATFVKKGGTCSWTLVTCTQVDQKTSVVFRSAIS